MTAAMMEWQRENNEMTTGIDDNFIVAIFKVLNNDDLRALRYVFHES